MATLTVHQYPTPMSCRAKKHTMLKVFSAKYSMAQGRAIELVPVRSGGMSFSTKVRLSTEESVSMMRRADGVVCSAKGDLIRKSKSSVCAGQTPHT